MVDVLHQDMYAYDIYAEYLNKIEQYALNSNINSLSLRYYKQNFPLTLGVHDELDVVVTDGYSRTYDIFDFSPVLQMQPLSYNVENDTNNQGVIRKTQGTLTLLAVIEPLPGDIFNFYQHGSTNEFFGVDVVNFVHSVKDLNIYELQFSTANWDKKSVEELNINEHYYYVKEFRKFYSSALYEDYAWLLENRNTMLIDMNKKYDCIKMFYTDTVIIGGKDFPLSDYQINRANSILLYLNEKVKLNIKLIVGKSIERNPDKLVIKLTEAECYIDDPNYVPPNIIDPNVPYNAFAGKVRSELLNQVYLLQEVYWKFIEYQAPLDGNPDTTGIVEQRKVFKEDAVDIVRDLNQNIIGE